MYLRLILVLVFVSAVLSSAIPSKDDELHDKREKKQHISDHDHFDDEGDHNSEYDHDAFLGEDNSKEFDKLSPDESKRRLGLIYNKIDSDKNEEVSREELLKWIQYVQGKYMETDANRQWEEIGTTGDKMSWLEYRSKSYGAIDGEKDSDDEDNEDSDPNDPTEEYRDAVKMERRDKKRYERADIDKDGMLDRKEFAIFIHPEESLEMKDLVVAETLEDIDKDGDGFISLEEYVGDMWTQPSNGESEPDWVERERKNFRTQRDKDQDGKLNNEEVYHWVMPDDYDHMVVETKHLLREADTNKDGVLSKDEVLAKHDVFVGSTATDYGDALERHDEF